jgi:hypothetical protein
MVGSGMRRRWNGTSSEEQSPVTRKFFSGYAVKRWVGQTIVCPYKDRSANRGVFVVAQFIARFRSDATFRSELVWVNLDSV